MTHRVLNKNEGSTITKLLIFNEEVKRNARLYQNGNKIARSYSQLLSFFFKFLKLNFFITC